MIRLCLIILLFLRPEITLENAPVEEFCYEQYSREFSKEALKQYIYLSGIKHPDIVFAQAMLETGEFSSKIFKENNNLFGMKLPKKRKTLALKSSRGHAVYLSWLDAVDDYILWQKMYKRTCIETSEEYFALLKKVYAEDSLYVRKLKKIIENEQKSLN